MSDSQKRSMPILPWMRRPVDLLQFEELPLGLVPFLDPRLKAALEKMSISSLFPVQEAVWLETIGPGSFERDLCINSPTGSGKTLAYALPIVQQLSTRRITFLRALIVLPTRDLALQVKKVFDAIAPAVGLKVGLAIGQSSIEDEISILVKKPKLGIGISLDPEDLLEETQISVDILVATPGRLMDHINTTKGFSLRHLCYLVVDETDRFLREEYQSWLPTVLRFSSSDHQETSNHETNFSISTFRRCGVERGFKGKTSPRLAKLVLSATLTQDPSKLSQLDLHHPLFLTAGHKRYKLPETLESCTLICESKMKPLYLVALLQSLRGEKCIVFTSSNKRTRRLTALLKLFGEFPFKISQFWGQQHQSRRSKTLDSFRKGEIDVLISSDAIARGMDVEGVRNVINYDMAPYVKTYIHRAGRTARAGHSGRCFTILRKSEMKRFKEMLQKAGEGSCRAHSLPDDSVDQLRPLYDSALEKLKEADLETPKNHKRLGTNGFKRKKGDEDAAADD